MEKSWIEVSNLFIKKTGQVRFEPRTNYGYVAIKNIIYSLIRYKKKTKDQSHLLFHTS